MKNSNKVLLGGLLVPIVIFLGSIIFLTINSTDDPDYQIKDGTYYDFLQE